MSRSGELADLLAAYYTSYYRDTLGLPDWREKMAGRLGEDSAESDRLGPIEEALGRALAGLRVLNVGCGTGGFNVAAQRAGAMTWGIDTSLEAVRICDLRRARGAGGHYVVAGAELLPFRDGAFDLVYCLSTLEHVRNVEAAVREMVRVLCPGGTVMLYAPNSWAPYESHYKILWPPQALTPPSIRRLYLRMRGRPTSFVNTLNSLSARRCIRLLRRAGATGIRPFGLASIEGLGPGVKAGLLRLYYRLFRIWPAIQLVARKDA